jgi:hypothetical protein
VRRAALLVMLLGVAGCGGGPTRAEEPLPAQAPGVGPGPAFRPPSLSDRAASGLPIAGFHCARRQTGKRFGAHLELFARGKVILVAPGIGIAPPRERDGAYVRKGRCEYPLRTTEPTGVIEVAPGGEPKTLGDLFAIWGQPLSRSRLAGFRGRVRAHVGGGPWSGDPRAIPLTRHAQVVLQVGPRVTPHSSYAFPPGL